MADTAFSKGAKTFILSNMDAMREETTPKKGRRWRGVVPRLAVYALFLLLVLFVAGFFLFCNLIADEPEDVARADGIVALTGGESRIPVAVKLLARKRASRLLISGVNPTTTKEELITLAPDSKAWFNCCIDIGRQAQNTIGNADETREWVEEQRFKSLIVVTASYHMPRSLAELRRALPDVELIPYPVTPRNLHMRSWWTHPGTLQLLLSEYVKFIPTLGRCTLSQIGHGHNLFNGTGRCLNGGYTG
jgi:uncharacterized SAM-binding protein YcdF (DUF218 family)